MMPFSPNENTGHIINYYIWFHKQVSTYIHSAQCFSSWFSGKDWEKLLNVNYLITIPNICLCQVSMIWLYKSPILYFCMLHHINEKINIKKSNFTHEWNYSETEKGSIRQPASYSSGRQKVRLQLKFQKTSQQI